MDGGPFDWLYANLQSDAFATEGSDKLLRRSSSQGGFC